MKWTINEKNETTKPCKQQGYSIKEQSKESEEEAKRKGKMKVKKMNEENYRKKSSEANHRKNSSEVLAGESQWLRKDRQVSR